MHAGYPHQKKPPYMAVFLGLHCGSLHGGELILHGKIYPNDNHNY